MAEPSRSRHDDPEAAARICAAVLLDSVSPAGVRLTTLQVSFPRFVLAEFNTHRVFSRNSASSRAIPTKKLLEQVRTNPARPIEWGRNRSGMQADDMLDEVDAGRMEAEWMRARDAACAAVEAMLPLHPHKQVVNRILEPFMTHTVIVTSTDWDNFFTLRCSKSAQPELRHAANLMRQALSESVPQRIDDGAWHLPLVQPDERALPVDTLKKVSAARCARVSYLTHDGKRDLDKDVELCDRLEGEAHLSPFEHVATPADDTAFHANFRGWIQMRKEIEMSHGVSLATAQH